MKKTFNVNGMHCNSCTRVIEDSLKREVNSVSANYVSGKVEVDFNEKKISEEKIGEIIKKAGYSLEGGKSKDNLYWLLGGVVILALFVTYFFYGSRLPEIQFPSIGQNVSLILLFLIGLLTGFHCVSMCGAFVVSYTGKNAIEGYKGFVQHLFYGGGKLISYTVIGGIFGLVGGIIAFSAGLRGWVSIVAGIFMIFYALSMFGLKFFRRFQFNSKFLSNAASKASLGAKGFYRRPAITGLLNGLFIACGPLQAMYLYAAGTGSFLIGATSLFAFGLGTLPVMLGFGSLASVISNKTTKRILKISALIVLILGLVMINRGMALTGFSVRSVTTSSSAGNLSQVVGGYQIVNMDVDASGYSPNSFTIKQGVPVKWNINVKQLTSCNSEILLPAYGIDKKLQQGLNTIEFIPKQVGTLSFSCWMGMIRGSFVVTSDGLAIQTQIQALNSSLGGICGGTAKSCSCGGQ